MKWAIGVVCLMLAVTAGARFYIFRLQDKEIAPGFYEKKFALEDFAFGDSGIPQGFRLSTRFPGGGENPAELDPPALLRLLKPAPALPEPKGITGTYATAYSNALGDQVVLVACQYTGTAAPQPPTGFLREGVFLVTAVAASPVLAESFLNTISEKVAKLKANGVKLNKVKTVGNVLLKLFMDILVGSFVFLLALFLTKYFFIIKPTEE